jgi:hypothetical protein
MASGTEEVLRSRVGYLLENAGDVVMKRTIITEE